MTKNQIKNYLLLPYDLLMLFFNIVIFKLFKINFKNSINTLIRLFCLTGGISNDIVSFFTKKKLKNNINKQQSDIDYDLINQNLNEEGYFIIENFLSQKDCTNLENFILKNKLIAKKKGELLDDEILFDPDNPKGVFYEMHKDKIFNSNISQNLVFNDFFYTVSRNYFKSLPFFDHMSFAVSAKSDEPDSDAAQLFHFDLDRPKWLKFFIYLNDVDDNNGPHYFVPKTHKNFGIKSEIRQKGYSRISDEIVENNYSEIKKITGKKGTLLIEDTRGLHKGSIVKKNYRCIALLQFNNSNFGGKNFYYKFKIIDEKNNYYYKENSETFSNIKNLDK